MKCIAEEDVQNWILSFSLSFLQAILRDGMLEGTAADAAVDEYIKSEMTAMLATNV